MKKIFSRNPARNLYLDNTCGAVVIAAVVIIVSVGALSVSTITDPFSSQSARSDLERNQSVTLARQESSAAQVPNPLPTAAQQPVVVANR